jgi:hypothetical protein
MKSEWLLFVSVDQHERLGNALGSDDAPSFAHDPETAGARGGETIVRVHRKEYTEVLAMAMDASGGHLPVRRGCRGAGEAR